MALSSGVWKKVMASYVYVLFWISLSFSMIAYKKYILDRKLYNWPFPISLAMINTVFCFALAYLLVRVFKVVNDPAASMTRDLYLKSVVPIGALYSLSLWFSNSAYIYLSVSFIQMLKALMPVAIYSIGLLLKKEKFKSDTMINMVLISLGVAIAAYGEAKFDYWGVMLLLLVFAFDATLLVLVVSVLKPRGICFNPFTMIYYVGPCCLVFLSVPWMIMEYPLLKDASSSHLDFVILGTNTLCAFALNWVVFLLVRRTSKLTIHVAGAVKDWFLIAFSWSVIEDPVTPISLLGYFLARLGFAYYNHSKLQALTAAESQQADEEAGRSLKEYI